MKTTNHTPGPWALLDRDENSRTLTHITNGAHIVCTLGTTRTDGSPNHSANANLIASAPDLLSAARNAANVLAAIATGQLAAIKPDSNALQELRAAISKAEGVK